MHWYSDTRSRAYFGQLVYESKSYRPGSGDQGKARQIAQRYLNWIRLHPRYGAVDGIAAIPPGNPGKDFDLPDLIARFLSSELGKPLVQIASSGTTIQKGLPDAPSVGDIAGKFSTSQNRNGRTVLAIDDIYDSGRTIAEAVRALRSAGAATALALTATKTASYCDGLLPVSQNWTSRMR